MKIGVIGGGVSGISIAKLLSKDHDVTVYEKSSSLGGLIKCVDINGNLYHKVGGHVFNTKNLNVDEWFWSHFDKDKEFRKAKRNAKILLNNRLIGYPIENYLYQLDQNLLKKIIEDLLFKMKQNQKGLNTFPNFETFLKENFGNSLYELYFKPYNYKIWKTDLSKVPIEWLEGKLPMPDYNQIIINNIQQKEESDMVHSTFYYAKEGGSQFIVDRLSQGLNVICSCPVTSIKNIDAKWLINAEFSNDIIIYTGDIRMLHHYLRSEDSQIYNATLSVKDLLSHGTSNLFCECDETDLSWLYLPDPDTIAHRIIYTGNFSLNNNRGSKRKTCVVEFSGMVSTEEMIAQLAHLPGNLTPIESNYESNSYVIQDQDTRSNVQKLKEVLEPKNFYLLGRFAEWEYYNMDKAIEEALVLSKKLLGM